MRFENRVALITGGAQGIGREIALQFAKEKAKTVIFDVNKDSLSKTIEELMAYSTAIGLLVDVTNLQEVEQNVNKIIDNFGRVDILVNNAGITRDNLLVRLSENDWDEVLTVNLKGAFNVSKAVSRFMLKEHYGKIINISSVVGLMGNAGQVNYAASKAGLIGLTKSLAKELGSRNINVNSVAPGYIKTAMTERLDGKIKQALLERIPLARLGEPLDVAGAVLFLASSDADYITGQVLLVDGGMV